MKINITEEVFHNSSIQNEVSKKRLITKLKYKDLIDLLKYIPNKYHQFYKDLKYDADSEQDNDYALASGTDDDEDSQNN